jgi:carbon starvation protein
LNSAVLIFAVLIIFALAYRLYGGLLSRLYGIDPLRPTPAHQQQDGIDFVSAKHWMVLFGHHFSSICGAGPIVGPALAVAYWGWVPSILWIIVGAIFLGAVSDFSALITSVRHEGKSLAEISGEVISQRARLFFSVFIFFALILVLAAFAIFAAKTLTAQPEVVFPSFGIIPVAFLVGWMMYRRGISMVATTSLGLGILVMTVLIGNKLPVTLPELFGLGSDQIWIVILMSYCFVAACLPVQYLLQPRDYLASYILIFAIALGLIGTVISHPPMQAAALASLWPTEWAGAGPLWPMLFVTIACGAISGFHALVSSGTTCKQLDTEAHACRIGYGGMLTEGLVGALVVVCVGAGLTTAQHAAMLQPGGPGPIGAFGQGYGNLVMPILGGYGVVFAVMALNTFILTTLDTATRISRYVLQELTGIHNRFLATGLVVAATVLLAFTGQWQRIWPAFGAANQLIAGLGLMVATSWLLTLKKPLRYTLIPSLFMMVTTVVAFGYQIYRALGRIDPVTRLWNPDWLLAGTALLLTFLALFMVFEVWKILNGWRPKPSMAKL